MKTKFCLMLLLVLQTLTGSYAQQTEEQKKEINKIKKSSLYLYAETTMPDKEEAMMTAIDMLKDEAQRWVSEKKKKQETDVDWEVVMTNVTQSYNKIELPRGNMYRAFAYVKKSDVITGKNVIVSDVKMPESEVEEIKEAPDPQPAEQPEAIKRLLALKMYDEVPACVETLKKEGLITEYNRYASLPNPDDYVLIIYNRAGEVEAILSEGAERINMRTLQADGVANYKGRGAIGVKLSK
ncbi:hypothetical protein QVO32_04570 [Bacteroides gallinaceum]|uniref:hypothetical protein n=1 Tax=Bacteroides gallinaceum TaxID=1462571 RepID=UPI0025AA32D5|nr:hypothetical protein [Bacteroides gallinaceum]MDN0078687.1 hypothetical protein [Bacteroides gallinaceum]